MTAKEERLQQEVKSWKETSEILGDKNILKSIQVSLKQIANGKGIPISQL